VKSASCRRTAARPARSDPLQSTLVRTARASVACPPRQPSPPGPRIRCDGSVSYEDVVARRHVLLQLLGPGRTGDHARTGLCASSHENASFGIIRIISATEVLQPRPIDDTRGPDGPGLRISMTAVPGCWSAAGHQSNQATGHCHPFQNRNGNAVAQNTISLSTPLSRPAGALKSRSGPTGTIPVGLMRRWLM
jgi:hypothetical protein